MKLLLALVGLTVIGSALSYYLRCQHRWVIKHRPEPTTKPLLLEWICFDCGKVLGTTDATPVKKNITDLSTRRTFLKHAVHADIRRRA